jgi:tRNA pseudouridine38-40 synthase
VKRTLKLTIAYDGGAYAGWQWQPNRKTLQQTIEAALEKIAGESIRVTASGRTDAGVHALGQVISFVTTSPHSAAVFQKALNAELPHDIAVLDACDAPDGFHAIRNCVRKRYRYLLHDGPHHDVFSRHIAWHYRSRLNADAMHRAAQAWLGTHDFRSFETHGSKRTSTVRTVLDIFVKRTAADGWTLRPSDNASKDFVMFEIEADGFLYNMVRTMVGTLVQIGRGVEQESWGAEVLAAQDRRAAGMTAPPQGLFLVAATYE